MMLRTSLSLVFFTAALFAGQPASNAKTDRVAQHNADPADVSWDTRFDSLGTDGRVLDIALDGSDVYVGGSFTTAGGVIVNGIARWDGESWFPLGSGIAGTTTPQVQAIIIDNGEILIGGGFTTAGGISVNHVARWDGSQWSTLGGISDGFTSPPVSDVISFNGDIYVCGGFESAGGIPVQGIARWNGVTWDDVGGGLGTVPRGLGLAFAKDASFLYVGGVFLSAGGVFVENIAKWDGNSWSNIGTTIEGVVRSLAIDGSHLYVGGLFTNNTPTGPVVNIGRWNGTGWHRLAGGANDRVLSVEALGSDIFVIGNFTAVGNIAATRIAKWNGTNWSTFGSGLNFTGAPFWSFAVAPVSSDEFYAGGDFDLAGSTPSNHFAHWAPPPEIDVSPASISDTLFTGGTADHTLTIRNIGGLQLTWQITADDPWVNPTPTMGVADDSALVNVTIDALGLPVGSSATTLRVQGNDPNNPEVTVPVQLVVLGGPHIEPSTTLLDFGIVPLGSVARDSVVLANQGTSTLNVTSIVSDNPDFTVLLANAVLTPGMSQAVPVDFAPNAEGSMSGSLQVQSNDPDESTLVIGLQGEGFLSPIIDVAPASISVIHSTGEVTTVDLVIRNTGPGNLIWQTGVSEFWLALSPDGGVTSPGDSTVVEVTLDAALLTGNIYDGQIQITSNAFVDPLVLVPVQMIVVSAPDIALSADSLVYNPTLLGASESLPLSISNIGHASLIVNSIGLDNTSFTTDTSLIALIPTGSKQLDVVFEPQAAGPIEGTLTIVSNDPDEDTLIVTLVGEGIVVTDVDNDFLSLGSNLAQNYPNPFNPSTTIAFWIKASGRTTLTIYDTAGRRVRRLLDAERGPSPAGHKVEWNGRNDAGQLVSTGVYFYELVAPGFTQTRKMVLLK